MARRRKPADRTPADLLSALAAALNDCEQAEVSIRFRHGAAYSHFGVVLPPAKKGGKWVARLFATPGAGSGGG